MSRVLLLLSSSVATLLSRFLSLFNNSVAVYPERSERSHSYTFRSVFNILRKYSLIIFLSLSLNPNLFSQTKQTETVEQIWVAYFNQTRFSNKWGTWTDI